MILPVFAKLEERKKFLMKIIDNFPDAKPIDSTITKE